MKKIWFEKAWADYLYWQSQDKKTLKRINQLVRDLKDLRLRELENLRLLKKI